MRVMMPFTLVARKVNNSIIIYYRYRKPDMTLSSLLSTGIKAENDTEKAIQSAKRKANLICMELYRSGKIHQESEILLKTYAKDFFTEKCKYIQWKISTGSKERKGLTQSTIVFYRRILRCQILPYLGNVPLKRLNAAKIKNFLISLKEKFSNKTINHTILVLNIILKQAVEENIIQSNPASNVSRLRVDKPNMNLYTFEELRALFNPCNWDNERLRSISILSCCTGLRISEALALKREDVREDYLDINKGYEDPYGFGDIKTHEKRKVPAVPELIKLLPDRDLLYEGSKKGQPYGQNAVRKALKKAMQAVGIDYKARKITFHSFRHFFNTYLEKEDVNPAKIRAVMGHKDSTMTGLYTNWNANEFPEVYISQRKLVNAIGGNDERYQEG